MTIAAALGWLASAHIAMLALPGQKLDDFNTAFAVKVDAGESCWARISGEPGSYGATSSVAESAPAHNYSYNLICAYRKHR